METWICGFLICKLCALNIIVSAIGLHRQHCYSTFIYFATNFFSGLFGIIVDHLPVLGIRSPCLVAYVPIKACVQYIPQPKFLNCGRRKNTENCSLHRTLFTIHRNQTNYLTKMPTDVSQELVEIPALGRHFELGTLYDAHTDNIVQGKLSLKYNLCLAQVNIFPILYRPYS